MFPEKRVIEVGVSSVNCINDGFVENELLSWLINEFLFVKFGSDNLFNE